MPPSNKVEIQCYRNFIIALWKKQQQFCPFFSLNPTKKGTDSAVSAGSSIFVQFPVAIRRHRLPNIPEKVSRGTWVWVTTGMVIRSLPSTDTTSLPTSCPWVTGAFKVSSSCNSLVTLLRSSFFTSSLPVWASANSTCSA